MKTYLKYLSRNKLYTIITVLGFATSLMFVILLGTYVRNEFMMDRFHSKQQRIALMLEGNMPYTSIPAAANTLGMMPEVEAYTMITQLQYDVRTGEAEQSFELPTLMVDSAYFSIFDLDLIEGDYKALLKDPATMIISKRTAEKLFGSKRAVGESLLLENGRSVRIVGVMKDWRSDTHISEMDAIAPLKLGEDRFGVDLSTSGDQFSTAAYVLLRPGVEAASLNAKLTELRDYKKNPIWTFEDGEMVEVSEASLMPLHDIHFNLGAKGGAVIHYRLSDSGEVMMYLGIALLIFVVSLLNYINLSLAQTSQLGRESALRRLLGSSRKSLIARNILRELGFFLFCVAMGFGLALLFEKQAELLLRADINILESLRWNEIIVALVLFLFVASLAALIPSVVVSRFRPIEVVRGRFRMFVRGRFSLFLIAAQFAVALVLLVVTGTIILQNNHMLRANMGYRTDDLISTIGSPDSSYRAAMRARLLTVPGVEGVSYASVPWYGASLSGIKDEATGELKWFQLLNVDTCFIDLVDLDVKRIANKEQRVGDVYISDLTVKDFHADLTNNEVKLSKDGSTAIAGFLPDIYLRNVNEQKRALVMYVLDESDPNLATTTLRLKTGANLAAVQEAIAPICDEFMPGKKLDFKLVNDLIKRVYYKETRQGKLLGIFAGLSLLIMLMGVTAMSIYLMRQKEKTLAIRKVMGASERQQLAYLHTTVLRAFAVACIVAWPLAYYISSRWLADFSYRINMPWWLYLAVPLLLLIVSLGITMAQSLHAARSNPIKYLKDE